MATLSESVQRIRPGVFAELQARIDAHTAKGGTLIPLHIGDTHLAPPEAARFERAIAGESSDGLYRYGATAGLAELREAFAARARDVLGISGVSGAAHVHLGAGGTHALGCAARAVLDAGDDVLVAAPYWPLSVGIFHACSARVVEVPFTSRLATEPGVDAGEVLASAVTPRAKAIYVTTPNNPDGVVLTRAQLESVARVAIENDLWVFSDEVYAEVAYDAEHVSIASLPGMAERTIVVQSLSKSHALAGARIGAVVAPEPVIAAARRVGVHTVFNVPVAMQRAAVLAMSGGDAWMRAALVDYRAARDEAAAALVGSSLRFTVAQGATYLFLDSSASWMAGRSRSRSSAPSITACCSRRARRSGAATSASRASASPPSRGPGSPRGARGSARPSSRWPRADARQT
jgi:aspartate/methionine/tyrosine aminotransferase